MAVCILIHAALFLVIFKLPGVYYTTGSDTQHVYWPAVQKLLSGRIPYRDPTFFVEYPPAGTAFFLLPALLHPTTLRLYDWLFAVEMLLADAAAVVLVALLARRLAAPVVSAVVAYGLLVPLLGAVVTQRYDLIPAALVLAALLALLCDRSNLAWLLLLIATLTKLYPAVLAPLFLLYDWRRGRRAGAALYGAGLIASSAAWLLLAPASLHHFLAWETRRGLEIESLPGSAVALLHLAGLPVHMVPPSAYGSWDVASALTPALESLSTLLTIGLLGAVYIAFARCPLTPQPPLPHGGEGEQKPVSLLPHERAQKPVSPLSHGARGRTIDSPRPHEGEGTHPTGPGLRGNLPEARALVTAAALAVLGLLLGSKLLSIQFLLWLSPLVAVQPRRGVVAVALGATALSPFIFPTLWNNLLALQPPLILLMALRNGLLVALFVLLWRGWAVHRAQHIDSPAG